MGARHSKNAVTADEAFDKLSTLPKPLLRDVEIPSWSPKPWAEAALMPPVNIANTSVVRERSGWPMRCVTATKYADYTTKGGVVTHTGTVEFPRAFHFPIKPLFPGSVVDVLCFGSAAVVMHELLAWPWRAWKRHFARVNHLCEKCKYDRKGTPADAPCPECGTKP
jgi:hypothetical protein